MDNPCPVCGSLSFTRHAILWDSLVREWELTLEQRSYIDDQQGLICNSCKSNLRSITLAKTILTKLNATSTFKELCLDPLFINLRILDINGVNSLTPFLTSPSHYLISYPEYDMQSLAFSDSSFDIVMHSDTLEHVPDSIKALKECYRVLVSGGFLAYTIPIIPEKVTRSREGLPDSYHGSAGNKRFGQRVYKEYGCNFWCELFEVGFRDISIYSIIYPASMAIIDMRQ